MTSAARGMRNRRRRNIGPVELLKPVETGIFAALCVDPDIDIEDDYAVARSGYDRGHRIGPSSPPGGNLRGIARAFVRPIPDRRQLFDLAVVAGDEARREDPPAERAILERGHAAVPPPKSRASAASAASWNRSRIATSGMLTQTE